MAKRPKSASQGAADAGEPLILHPVFSHRGYRAYILALIAANPERRGLRSQLAEAMGCTPSYFSQVLSDQASLSLDQLHRLARFLKIDDAEWTYLRELVIEEKCATEATRDDARRRAEAVRAQSGATFFQATPNVAAQDTLAEPTLFSLVHWDVFHLLGAPNCSKPDELAARLKVPRAQIMRALEDWRRIGLIEAREDGSWRCRAVRFGSHAMIRATTGLMYRMRFAVRAFEGRGEPPRYAAIRLKAEHVATIRERIEALFDEAWRLAADSEAEGDQAMWLAVDCDVT